MKKLILLLVLSALCAAACQKYDDEIAELQRRIDELATANSKVNDNVAALEKIVEALQKDARVVSIVKITEGGKVVGYTVTFTEDGKPSESVTVYDSPANISVGMLDGKYYWMVAGEWLTDDAGNKIEACTSAPVPEFRLTNGTIEVSLDEGVSWKAVGEVAEPVIDRVTETDTEVTFFLAGGSAITLKKWVDLTLSLSSTSLTMAAGGGRSVAYTIAGGSEDTDVIVYAKDGWSATVSKTDAASGVIQISSPSEAGQSQVLVFVSDKGRSIVASISVVSNQ